MLKGTNRNVIVLRTDRGSRFEAAYFLLRRGEGAGALGEAKALLMAAEGEKKKRGRVPYILCAVVSFVLGIAAGSAAVFVFFGARGVI